jgi:hypothetical protein
MGSSFGKSPFTGLPVSPITDKINKAIGLTTEEKETTPVVSTPIDTSTRPELDRFDADAEKRRKGRRLTILTSPIETSGEGSTLI